MTEVRRSIVVKAALAFTTITTIGALTGCGGGSTPVTASVVATTVPGATATVAPAAAAATPAAVSSPADVAALLAAYTSGYRFSTSVSVNGVEATKVDGRRVGDGTALTVSSSGVQVEQVITATGTWAREAGQDWAPVEAPAAAGDPIAALSAPTAVAVNADGTWNATYPAAAFGLPAGDITVKLSAAGGRLSALRYETTVSGQQASVDTAFSILDDPTPVSTPA